MKKWLSLLLAVLLLFSLTACTQEEVDTTLEILDAVVSALPEEEEAPAPQPEETLPDSQAPPTVEQSPVILPSVDQQPPVIETQPPVAQAPVLPEDGQYDDKDNVALYIHLYGKLPSNYVTKKDAEALYGWQGGALDVIAPGKAIGGSYYGNYEGLLPDADGREWTECDIGTIGQTKRGAERIVFSNDGLIYYTPDHYESFELLYGEE
ncbi:MAG: ribonuclease [Clostridia bacterium]|nr:ribonuclease [Clostridia bacterium]